MHQSSIEKMQSFRERYLNDKELDPLVIFDLGSHGIRENYRVIFDSPNWRYHRLGLEPGENIDIVLQDPYNWREIATSSIDVLIFDQLFEQIEFFWLTVAEVGRVLKPGGLCCIIAPSSAQENHYLANYWRFSSDGFSALARYANLEMLNVSIAGEATDSAFARKEWLDSVLVARKPITDFNSAQFRLPTIQPYTLRSLIPYPEAEIISEEELGGHTWKKQLDLIGYRKQVVEFGCGSGGFSRLLKHRNCQVVGIEQSEAIAKYAEAHCDHVIVADLESVAIPELLAGQKFDVAVFGDVLEHLRDPWRILQEVSAILKPDGYIVASIPNVAHGAIRLALLQGRFNYAEMGLLDATHLRFFTRDTVRALFEDAGYLIETIDRTTVPIFEDCSVFERVDRQDFNYQLVAQIEQDPDAETLQFIIRAFPLSSEGKYTALEMQYKAVVNHLQQLQFETQEREHAYAKLKLQLHQTQKQLQTLQSQTHQTQAQLDQTQAQLDQTQAQLDQTQAHLQHTEVELQQTRESLTVSRSRIAAMESSKFWRIRDHWMQIKKKLGLQADV